MRVVSALADSALLLPAAFALLVYLLALRKFVTARLWLVALVACAASTIASKLLFQACGPALSDVDRLSPSGHVSLATVFYGCLAILVGSGRPVWQGRVLAGLVGLLVFLVAVSRVRTGAHSTGEVAVGFVIGGACVGLFRHLHRRAGRPGISPLPLAIGFGLALALLGGRHFSLEHEIARAAAWLGRGVAVCAAARPSGA